MPRKIGMIFLLMAGLILVALVASRAENRKSIELTAEGKYHLQAILAQERTIKAQQDYLVLQFLQQNPQAQDLQKEMQRLAKEQQALVDQLFKDAKLSTSEYQINPDSGQFVRIAK